MAKAYHLESHFAEHPRAVLGDGVARYLDFLEQGPAASIAARCRDVICDAPDDGRSMVQAPQILQADTSISALATTAYKWVKQELAAHEASGDQKLVGRYQRLLGYFEAHGYESQSVDRQ